MATGWTSRHQGQTTVTTLPGSPSLSPFLLPAKLSGLDASVSLRPADSGYVRHALLSCVECLAWLPVQSRNIYLGVPGRRWRRVYQVTWSLVTCMVIVFQLDRWYVLSLVQAPRLKSCLRITVCTVSIGTWSKNKDLNAYRQPSLLSGWRNAAILQERPAWSLLVIRTDLETFEGR